MDLEVDAQAYEESYAKLTALIENPSSTRCVPGFMEQHGASLLSEENAKPYLDLCQKVAALRRHTAEKKAVAAQLASKLKLETGRSENLDREISNVRREAEQKKTSLLAMRKKVDSKSVQLERQKAELETYPAKVMEHLGLEVSIREGHDAAGFFLTYSGLDKDHPEAKCVCEVHVEQPSGSYKVGKTLPELDCGLVSELQSILRETNDLSGFVVMLRKGFKSALKTQ